MVNGLDKVYTTKNIMATEKQKELIYKLIDDLSDFEQFNQEYYDGIDVENLSKQDAKELISDLIEMEETLFDEFSFAWWYDDYNY